MMRTFLRTSRGINGLDIKELYAAVDIMLYVTFKSWHLGSWCRALLIARVKESRCSRQSSNYIRNPRPRYNSWSPVLTCANIPTLLISKLRTWVWRVVESDFEEIVFIIAIYPQSVHNVQNALDASHSQSFVNAYERANPGPLSEWKMLITF